MSEPVEFTPQPAADWPWAELRSAEAPGPRNTLVPLPTDLWPAGVVAPAGRGLYPWAPARRQSAPDRVAARAEPPPTSTVALETYASVRGPALEPGDSRRPLRDRLDSRSSLQPGGGFLANARALLLIVAGPVVTAALQFGMPYDAVPNRIARAFLFAVAGTLGGASSAAGMFAIFLWAPAWRVVPSYVALFVLLASLLFVAANAAYDLTRVPFGYAACLPLIVLSNQICARLHARLLARSAAAAPFAPIDSEAGAQAAEAAPPPDPARALATFGKFQAANTAFVVALCGYLFVFSVARSSVAQILINVANSSLCFLFAFVKLRIFARPLATALPHGDAAVLDLLTNLLLVRVFRQLAFFRVTSVYVYLVSLCTDLLALVLPSSPLLRLARPLARFLLARPPVAPAPPPEPAPKAAAAGEPAAFDEELWVYNLQAGFRSMVLWQAVISWVAAAVFVTVIAVARWGPAAGYFPYSPATFDGPACSSALLFSLLTAAVNALAVAGVQAAVLAFPPLRGRFALAASWRLLRERAALLALAFASCSSVAFLVLFRQANVFSFAFPESYPPETPAG